MPTPLHSVYVLTIVLFGSFANAKSPDLATTVGTVEKFEQETLTILVGEKTTKILELKITGTSNFFLLTPQSRAGKTVLTQRTAQATDLAKGQSIAVIYADVDKEHVLLNAVMRPVTFSTQIEEDGFTPLMKGNDLDQFEIVGVDKGAVVIKESEIRLTGKAQGYVATKDSYRNYVLQFEWMYEKHSGKPSDGNSGLLLHVQGPAKVWPKSIEAQIWYKEFGSFFTLDGGKFNPKKDDPVARNKAVKSLGEWNKQEVICQDGTITLKVNGVEYASGIGAQPDQGKIAWMFEGSPIRYRNLKIKKLK